MHRALKKKFNQNSHHICTQTLHARTHARIATVQAREKETTKGTQINHTSKSIRCIESTRNFNRTANTPGNRYFLKSFVTRSYNEMIFRSTKRTHFTSSVQSDQKQHIRLHIHTHAHTHINLRRQNIQIFHFCGNQSSKLKLILVKLTKQPNNQPTNKQIKNPKWICKHGVATVAETNGMMKIVEMIVEVRKVLKNRKIGFTRKHHLTHSKFRPSLGQLEQNLIKSDTTISTIIESEHQRWKDCESSLWNSWNKHKRQQTNQQTKEQTKTETITHWMELLAFMLLWLPAVRHCQKLLCAKWRIEKRTRERWHIKCMYDFDMHTSSWLFFFFFRFVARALHTLACWLSFSELEMGELKMNGRNDTQHTHAHMWTRMSVCWCAFVCACVFVSKSPESTHSK